MQDTLKAISDPTRRKILMMLKDGRMQAGEIASAFSTSQATISHHLSVLKKANLIFEEKEWRSVYYHLNLSVVEEIIVWFSALKLNESGENNEEKK